MPSLATWNINSVRLRLPTVLDFLKEQSPDVLCLQEIKCQNDQFPAKEFAEAGYEFQAVHGQKGYHGVAIISKTPLLDVTSRLFCEIPESRHVSAKLNFAGKSTTVHNFYIPAGGDEPDPEINHKFKHKLQFLAEMQDWFDDIAFDKGQIICGDFNIAPHENDVWGHKQLLKVVSHTPIETEALDRLLARRNWADLVRQAVPYDQKLYTWWSYRAKDWDAADKGRRLDHIWGTQDFVPLATGARVLREYRGNSEKPSDHVPVIVDFETA